MSEDEGYLDIINNDKFLTHAHTSSFHPHPRQHTQSSYGSFVSAKTLGLRSYHWNSWYIKRVPNWHSTINLLPSSDRLKNYDQLCCKYHTFLHVTHTILLAHFVINMNNSSEATALPLTHVAPSAYDVFSNKIRQKCKRNGRKTKLGAVALIWAVKIKFSTVSF